MEVNGLSTAPFRPLAASVSERLLGGGVQQDRDVDTLDMDVVAVGPFDHQHPDVADVDGVVPDLARLTTHALEHQVIGAGVERGEDAVDLVEVGLRRSAQVLGQRRSPGLLVAGQPRVVADSGGVAVGTGLEQCREFLAHRVVVLPGFDQATQRAGPIGAQPLGIVVAGDPPGIVVSRHHVRPEPVGPEVVGQQRADLGLADPRPAVHGDHRPAVRGHVVRHQQLPQPREDRLGLGHVALADLDAVTRHVARRYGRRIGDVRKLEGGHRVAHQLPPRKTNSLHSAPEPAVSQEHPFSSHGFRVPH